MSLTLAAASCPESNPGCFPEDLPLGPLFEFKPFLFEDSTLFAFNRVGMLYLLAGRWLGETFPSINANHSY